MAFKYKFIKVTSNTPPTLIIKVFRDGQYIYRYADYLGTPSNEIVNHTKEYLRSKYGEEGNILEPDSRINVLATSSDPEFSEESKKLPQPPQNLQTTTQAPPSQANNTSSTVVAGSNQPPAKVEQKQAEPAEGVSKAKGFGKITSDINKIINKIRVKINDFYYGKTDISTGKKLANPLDYGLINLLNLLASIDLCAIFTFAANKLGNQFNTKPFNPDDKSQTTTTLGKTKYQIQYAAYQIQTIIDGYYTSYGDLRNNQSKNALGTAVRNISNYLEILLSPTGQNPLQSPELKTAFPSISIFDNYLQNAAKFLSLNQNIDAMKPTQIDDVLKYIDKTRQVCISIQALNNPANLISFADTFLGAGIADALSKLDKVVDPKRLVPVIKKIIDVCNKIQSACNQILGFINTAKSIVQILTVLTMVLKTIAQFLKALPIPNLFTTAGITTTIGDACAKLTTFADNLLKRLSEVNTVLENIYYLIQDLSIKIGNIIDIINLVSLNLQSCDPGVVDPDLINQLNTASDSLKKTKADLDSFVETYDRNKKKNNTTFGDYTIVILSEQTTDDSIQIKRRYGAALNKLGQVVVQSSATFASDDQIIIQEVKLLLMSKNLVKSSLSSLNPNELAIMQDAMNYLEDPNISLETIDGINFNDGLDDPENEDEEESDESGDQGLNLNAFVSKLKGGRKLRRRMRKKMAKQKQDLVNSLAATDKGGKFSSSTIRKQKISAIKDLVLAKEEQIKILKEQIAKLTLAAATTTPIASLVFIRQIKVKKDQIKDIQKEINQLNLQLASIK